MKTYEGFRIHHDEFDEKIWKEYLFLLLQEIHMMDYILSIVIEIFCLNTFKEWQSKKYETII